MLAVEYQAGGPLRVHVETVAEVARGLGADWHTIMDAVRAYGTPLIEHPDRIGEVSAFGLDECRRRMQNETLGHRGRKHDPLHRSRRLLTKGHERLDEKGNEKLQGLLEAGDPKGEVRMTWHAEETLCGLYASIPGHSWGP